MLSLRMPVITRYDGVPFYKFLGLKDYELIKELREVFKEVLGVKNPRIDYVRFEISLNPEGMPREERVLEDLLGWKVKAWVTDLEYQLASKIRYKIGKDFGSQLPFNLHDILKAVLDLRLLGFVDCDKAVALAEPINWDVAKRNLRALLTPPGLALWERNYHYILVRKKHSLKELVERVQNYLQV